MAGHPPCNLRIAKNVNEFYNIRTADLLLRRGGLSARITLQRYRSPPIRSHVVRSRGRPSDTRWSCRPAHAHAGGNCAQTTRGSIKAEVSFAKSSRNAKDHVLGPRGGRGASRRPDTGNNLQLGRVKNVQQGLVQLDWFLWLQHKQVQDVNIDALRTKTRNIRMVIEHISVELARSVSVRTAPRRASPHRARAARATHKYTGYCYLARAFSWDQPVSRRNYSNKNKPKPVQINDNMLENGVL
ncbi:unnamed protein product [Chrysodeixis includens]|uniref:Uncharacterized protein n=1 Tax=Chrysodeixis includens TaxID=689277 RepID=A0A9N8Q0K2_CHRIL|nr:unnamed protein product [Chrysodeixis includens]